MSVVILNIATITTMAIIIGIGVYAIIRDIKYTKKHKTEKILNENIQLDKQNEILKTNTNNETSYLQDQIKELSVIMEFDDLEKSTPIYNLSYLTVVSPTKSNEFNYIYHNTACLIESIIFSWYIVLSSIAPKINNSKTRTYFLQTYRNKIYLAIIKRYNFSSDTIRKLFDDRFYAYEDAIIHSDDESEFLHEFKNYLLLSYVNNDIYAENKIAPRCILDIDIDLEAFSETVSYFNYFYNIIDTEVTRAIIFYNSL